MQTFLPYPDFTKSAQCLDRLRLGKQRLECWQILRTLVGVSSGWKNHPAVRMWRGYEGLLRWYGLVICREWKRRGYKDNLTARLAALGIPSSFSRPQWLGGPIHASHRSNLLRKDPVYYGQFGWTEGPDLPYVWPV